MVAWFVLGHNCVIDSDVQQRYAFRGIGTLEQGHCTSRLGWSSGFNQLEATMAVDVRFDWRKATEVLVYITSQVPDMYTALKVLYFADKIHLSRYGRLICDDRYVAMRNGPVPSGAYDLVKAARGDDGCRREIVRLATGALRVDRNTHTIEPVRAANRNLLSDSDIECIDSSIMEYGKLSFDSLRRLSHDEPAYQKADRDDFMPLEDIVASLPNGDALMEYLRVL